jgi:hypothetical protein
MEKLYRLVGAAGISFEAFGVTIGVRVNEPATLAILRDRLPPGYRKQEAGAAKRLYSFYLNRGPRRYGVRRFHTVYSDEQILHRSENETDLYEEFERDVDSFIAETSTTRFFVHAGVVGWNGKAIVIPGRSFSGKTTLVAEFLSAGATYYSDEFAVFDQDGYVHPFSRPLGLRPDGSDKQTSKSRSEFASRIGKAPLPLGLLILTEYKKSAAWRPRATSPGSGVLNLLANSLSARVNPAWALRVLIQANEGAWILRGVRGEAREVVQAVRRKFGDRIPANSREQL